MCKSCNSILQKGAVNPPVSGVQRNKTVKDKKRTSKRHKIIYCATCGAPETMRITTGTFDTNTGLPKYKYRCPNDCAHGNHEYHCSQWGYMRMKCMICGEVESRTYGQGD